MISSVLAAALLMAQAAPDAAGAQVPMAAAPAAPAPVAAKGPKVNKDGLVCHTEEVLGSRIPKRICFTPEQLADRKQQDQETLERLQSQNGYNKQ
jgi:hypothetical protein